jgi:hypothetical protein
MLGNDSPIIVFFIPLSFSLLNGKRNHFMWSTPGTQKTKSYVAILGASHFFARLSLAPGFSRVNPVIPDKTRFNGLSLHAKAVETASRWFANVVTGLKPGANENIPPFVHNLRCTL